MSEEVTQPVAQPVEAQPTATPETQSAQPSDLESFLSDFEVQTNPQPAPQQAVSQPAQDQQTQILALQMKLDNIERTSAQTRDKADEDRILKTLKGSHEDIENYEVKGWIQEQAEHNPAIQQIFNNRFQNPGAFNRLVNVMAKDFGKVVSKRAKAPDAGATEDRMAVAAAVKGTSTKAPEAKAPNYGAMSDREFKEELKKYGF